jgi:hypothetical protein
MFRIARSEAPLTAAFWFGILLTCLSPILFFIVVGMFSESMQMHGVTPRTLAFLLIAPALLLVGVGLLIYNWRLVSTWDPNGQPVEARMREGRKYSLSREDYERLRPGAAPVPASGKDGPP